MSIQSTYDSNIERGQVGQLSRPNAPYDGDRIQIGATGLVAGAAFKLTAGKAVPMTGEDDASAVEGVLLYEVSAINTDGEHIDGYAVDEWVPYVKEGYVYGLSGEVVAMGAQVAFDPADSKWYASSLATVDQEKMLNAGDAWTAEDLIVEVKVGAKVPAQYTP